MLIAARGPGAGPCARGRAGSVVGVGVDGRHQPGRDTEGVVEDLHHRHEAVRRARGIGDDVVLSRVVGVFVDADHERGVDVGRRGRDDDLFRSRAEVLASALARGESSGRLDDDVDVQFAQGSSAGLRSASTLMVLDRRSYRRW